MSPAELLRELEPLTHAGRMRRMVELGRAAARDSESAATLAALEAGGFRERHLALQSCYGSGDAAHVLRALVDPSGTICGLAARLVPVVCDDAQAEAALAAASHRTRRVLLRQLAKRGRRAPIDAFLASLAARGDERLTTAIRFGSPEVAARFIEPAMERASASDWRHLARRHPDLTANALRRRAEAAGHLDTCLIALANTVLPMLAEVSPDSALPLVRALARHAPLAQLELWRLAERRPAEIADLVLHSRDRAHVSFNWVARRLDIERLLALASWQAVTLHERRDWFRRLTPQQRAELYAAGANGWRDSDGCLEPWLVGLLRRDQREHEARRHLSLPALATHPAQRLPYAAFLPWEEARVVLDPCIHSPNAELRATALATLITAVHYHRDHLADLLAIVYATDHEQDPIRGAILTGLAGVPLGMWRAGHLETLGEIIRQALAAPDLSVADARAVQRLIVSLLPFHPAWSSQFLEHLEASLAGHSDPQLRWMALRVLQNLARDARGWDEERLARLRVYRSDPSWLVSKNAEYTRLPG
jgi:hypothetical protein